MKLLGTELESIQQAEDREMFRTLMNDLNVPVPESDIVNTVEQAFEFKEQVVIHSSFDQPSLWAVLVVESATTMTI